MAETVSDQKPIAHGPLKVVVIGAGFSGLVSAFYLSRAGYDVEIFDRNLSSGGMLSTLQLPQGPVETAANALLNSYLVEELFAEIGLRAIFSRTEAKRRYIFRWGKPRRWPLSFSASFRLLRFGVLYPFIKRRLAPKFGESVSAWGERVLGSEATETLLVPALLGIYAGDPRRLSARLAVGRLFGLRSEGFLFEDFVLPQPKKAKKVSRRGSVSAPGGMGELTEVLHSYLIKRGVRFHFGCEADLPETTTTPIVVATSAYDAARLLKSRFRSLSASLERIEFLPLTTVTVFHTETKSEAPRLSGFGCLFPPSERRPALGVLFNSSIFENRVKKADERSETWIFGGAGDLAQKFAGMPSEDLIQLIEEERRFIFGWNDQIVNFKITRWPKALPHYTLDFEVITRSLLEEHGQVVLMGNYLGAIGLSRILERAEALPRYMARNFAKRHAETERAK